MFWNHKMQLQNCNFPMEQCFVIYFTLLSTILWQSLKSGPETWDPGPWDLRLRTPGPGDLGSWDHETQDPETQDSGTLRPRTLGASTLGLWDPGTQDPHTQDPGTGTSEHRTLTSRILEMGPWNLEIATLRPRILRAGPWELNLWCRFQVSQRTPQIELTLIVKQIMIIKS